MSCQKYILTQFDLGACGRYWTAQEADARSDIPYLQGRGKTPDKAIRNLLTLNRKAARELDHKALIARRLRELSATEYASALASALASRRRAGLSEPLDTDTKCQQCGNVTTGAPCVNLCEVCQSDYVQPWYRGAGTEDMRP